MRHFRSLPLFCLLMIVPACGPLGLNSPPQPQLANIRAGAISVFKPEGEVILNIVNPNNDPITVTGATYELILENAHVGRILSIEKLEVPGKGSAEQHATLYLRDTTMLNHLRMLMTHPNISYAINGTMQVAAGSNSGTVEVQSAGVLNAKPADEPKPAEEPADVPAPDPEEVPAE